MIWAINDDLKSSIIGWSWDSNWTLDDSHRLHQQTQIRQQVKALDKIIIISQVQFPLTTQIGILFANSES